MYPLHPSVKIFSASYPLNTAKLCDKCKARFVEQLEATDAMEMEIQAFWLFYQ